MPNCAYLVSRRIAYGTMPDKTPSGEAQSRSVRSTGDAAISNFILHWGVIWYTVYHPRGRENLQRIDRASHTFLAPIHCIDIGLGGSDNLVADVFQRVAAAVRA
jgi:hypothetical protein